MDVTLESLLNSWWEYTKRNIYTAIPARIVGLRNEQECKVDVQPLINFLFTGNEDGGEWPTILNVPVMFPSSSASAFTFPLKKGDSVLVVFAQRSLDVFKGGDGTPQPPNDYRGFDARDAIAIPGLWPFGLSKNKESSRYLSHSTEDTVIAHNIGTPSECEVRLTPSGAIKVNGADVKVDAPLSTTSAVTVGTGATGSFTTPLGQIVTVTDGIITNIF